MVVVTGNRASLVRQSQQRLSGLVGRTEKRRAATLFIALHTL
jgi:hypothetical protein